MNTSVKTVLLLSAWLAAACCVQAGTNTVSASKDTFARSNKHTRNSGANPVLYIARSPNIRTLMAFDLSGVTNRIQSARLIFRAHETVAQPVELTIAPMVQTESNQAWGEGLGALGAIGQNSRPGEACYGWSAFPDVQWEDRTGSPVVALGTSSLWGKPVVARRITAWEGGRWIQIDIEDVGLLESVRTSGKPSITFGLWGTSGLDLYGISSKESGYAPELILTVDGKGGDT